MTHPGGGGGAPGPITIGRTGRSVIITGGGGGGPLRSITIGRAGRSITTVRLSTQPAKNIATMQHASPTASKMLFLIIAIPFYGRKQASLATVILRPRLPPCERKTPQRLRGRVLRRYRRVARPRFASAWPWLCPGKSHGHATGRRGDQAVAVPPSKSGALRRRGFSLDDRAAFADIIRHETASRQFGSGQRFVTPGPLRADER